MTCCVDVKQTTLYNFVRCRLMGFGLKWLSISVKNNRVPMSNTIISRAELYKGLSFDEPTSRIFIATQLTNIQTYPFFFDHEIYTRCALIFFTFKHCMASIWKMDLETS